jgi:hypothetical protein
MSVDRETLSDEHGSEENQMKPTCEWCDMIEEDSGTRHCPVHQHGETSRADQPPIAGSADLESPAVLEAGSLPMDESPLFGGARQKDLFS